jgi:predicted transposase YbfD/YdcC
MDLDLEAEAPRARLTLLLHEFARIEDDRQSWRVAYPLEEVLLLLTCATICSCDDFDDIVAWGGHHLGFLRGFAEFHHGIPCARWLRTLLNRMDPLLFARCFESWIAALWPGRHDLIAIDGKTARRTHGKGLKALHTLTAYATNARLALAQLSVPEKTNEITAIPDLLDQLAQAGQLEGALVTIDAMGTQVEIAGKILSHKADYLLPLKGNQPTLEAEVIAYFATAPEAEIISKETVEKGHGRIETRSFEASGNVDWIVSTRSYPGQPRFAGIETIMKVTNRTEHADKCTFDIRYYISSAPLDIERLAAASRGHWGVESFHWLLDVEFKEDLSRYRAGHGAKNMAIVRRFALGLVRTDQAQDEAARRARIESGIRPKRGVKNKDRTATKGSVKTRRKRASWDPAYLLHILNLEGRPDPR